MGISEKALINTMSDIEKLIPHRDPMIMVDTLYSVNQETNQSVSGLTIKKDNIFVKNGKFIEAGMIEHVAQSAALRIGYIFNKINKTIPIGFICSIKKIKVNSLTSIGHKLYTKITILQEVGNLTLIEFSTKDDEMTLLMEGQMNIILDL